MGAIGDAHDIPAFAQSQTPTRALVLSRRGGEIDEDLGAQLARRVNRNETRLYDQGRKIYEESQKRSDQ